jgi:hypothetical protein
MKELWDPDVVLVHVFTFRGAMAVRVEAHPTKADALEAVGLEGRR